MSEIEEHTPRPTRYFCENARWRVAEDTGHHKQCVKRHAKEWAASMVSQVS